MITKFQRWCDFFPGLGRSLIFRLTLLAVFLVTVGLALRLFLLVPFLKETLIGLSASRQLTIAEYVANDVDERIASRKELIAAMARQLPRSLLSDRQKLSEWLAERFEIYPKFSRGMVVVSSDGKSLLAEYPSIPGRAGLVFNERDWFKKSLETLRPVIGKPVMTRTDFVPAIAMAAPILDEAGNVAAVLAGVADIGAADFLEQLQTKRIGRTGGFLLISPADNIFVSADRPEMILKPLPKPGVNLLHDRAMAGFRGTGVTVNAVGVEELSAIVSVPSAGWFLVARMPTEEAFEAVESTIDFLVRSGLIAGGAVIVLLMLILPRMFGPLVQTSRQIHGMAKGEIELQPVPVVRPDEVGDLAQGFNFLLTRLRDMTGQKLDEERLRLAERERMEASLRQWMADTSHELRTPISVLRAQIEAIQDGVHEADAKTLDVLLREVMGLSRLVDDLYTLARSDVGRLDAHRVPVLALEILTETVSAFTGRFHDAGLFIRWDGWEGDGPEPATLGDPAHLKQIFSNLLENSLHYTDRGGGLSIAASLGDDFLHLSFDDTPPGVPEQALGRVFDRFYRVDASRSREHGGSGIGLSVCKNLAEAMGGRIAAAPSPRGGLRVILSLPVLPGDGE